jgi:hypothetical protein
MQAGLERSMRSVIRRLAGVALAVALVAPAPRALAWGATGHRMIGQLGVAALPPELPAFLRTSQSVQDIGELAREPDRWKAAGKLHDTNRDPGHFLDLGDDGKIYGGPPLDPLPPTRSDYEAALRVVGTDSYHAGYLPYTIADGWQQLVKDFSYWRILTVAIPREADPARKAWMQRDLMRREALILSDLGEWAHYVGDGSQPMHVSVHFNGWGPFPNPNGYTQDRVHAPFEGALVRHSVSLDQVRAKMTPPNPCHDSIEACTVRYLIATNATVVAFYALEKAGGFTPGDPRGPAFAAERIAAGAAELRDLTTTAWEASADGNIGYPAITVDQVVHGGVDPYDALYGED